MISIDANRTRGDTFRESFVLQMYDPSGVLIDISTLTSMTMTVNSLESPPDDTTQLLQIVGAVVDVAASQIEFVGAFDVLPIGVSYYDVEVVLASGEIYTPFRGRFIVTQDVTKP